MLQRSAHCALQKRAMNCCKLNPKLRELADAVLPSSHFVAMVIAADVGVADCKALALKARL
jgi:hypothetical protein